MKMSDKKKNKKEKKEKEKVVYYDDGSSISDMSEVKPSYIAKAAKTKSTSTFKEKWKTYWAAVKMMLLPMFFVLAVIFVLYLITMLTVAK